MKSIKALNYSIYFNTEGYKVLNDYLSNYQNITIFILVDNHTQKYCLPHLLSQLKTDNKLEIVSISSGEKNKNLKSCEKVWNLLSELGADRNSVLINLGGGVVSDLGGFVASTFKRGIKFINIPTTLLSMVDASIGGKTGVDLGVLKNQVGLFSNPSMLVIDSTYLKTLPSKEFRSGIAEIIKYGLTFDIKLFNQIINHNNLSINELNDIIYKSISIKNTIVLEDFKELNLRKTLNFGHTLGHAIESYFLKSEGKESLTHGESIAIGMVLACYISTKQLNFSKDKLNEIAQKIISVFGKVTINKNDYQPIIDLLKHDKKNLGGKAKFILLYDTEKYKINCNVDEHLITEALDYYISF